MKKTNKVKMGPLGTPLGNPLAYFNSLRDKRTPEPKQTFKFGGLRKKDCGGDTGVPCPESTPNIIGAAIPLNKNITVGANTQLGTNGINNTNVGANYASTNGNVAGGVGYNLDKNTFSGTANITNPNGSVIGFDGSYNASDGTVGGGASWTNKRGGKFALDGTVKDGKIGGNASYTTGSKALFPNVRIGVGTGSGLKIAGQKKGGAVKMKKGGTHKMPNGKMMLNSAMKKRTFKKK